MPPKKDKLSRGVQSTWPEVFKDIKVDVIPIEYLTTIRVIFKDNKVWEIDMQSSRNKLGDDKVLEDVLQELFNEYENSIGNIDFRLDTERLKNDIQKRTRVFMKKGK
tara:strand:+ start:6155 stop:6475 length:321 start_codon:yes stop_codon:yes gene_type:complete